MIVGQTLGPEFANEDLAMPRSKSRWPVAVSIAALGLAAFGLWSPRVTSLRTGAFQLSFADAPVPLPRVTPVAPRAAPSTNRTRARVSDVKTEEVFSARWGGGKGELGRRSANESSPEGPMSFAVDPRGRAFVLDQVNGRVQIFEPGVEPRSLPVPGDTYQDVALTSDDGLVLLDRLSKESVAFADRSGKVTHEIPLAGKGVAEGGDVTGLFQRDDGTWVEVKHANLVKLAEASGDPVEDRTIVQGRFGADGSVLRASKSGANAAFIAQKTRDGVTPLAKVSFDLPVWQLLELDTDTRGRVFLGASLLAEALAPGFEVQDAREIVVVLDSTGTELFRVELPANSGAEESFRRIRVGADGAVYHLAYGDEGATMRRFSL